MPTKTYSSKTYKGSLFMDECLAAGVSAGLRVETAPDGSSVTVTFDNAGDEAAIDSVEAAHDATAPSTAEAIDAVAKGSKDQASGIPNWASWDEATALNWHDTNIAAALPVANLTEANALLEKMENENRALVRLVLALRNKIWPDLQS